MYHGLLIGKQIQIATSSDHTLTGRSGIVVDETKNLIMLLTKEGRQIKIPKSVVTLNLFNNRSSNIVLDGSKLIGTPSDRIKG